MIFAIIFIACFWTILAGIVTLLLGWPFWWVVIVAAVALFVSVLAAVLCAASSLAIYLPGEQKPAPRIHITETGSR